MLDSCLKLVSNVTDWISEYSASYIGGPYVQAGVWLHLSWSQLVSFSLGNPY